jgi:hypothetical protein
MFLSLLRPEDIETVHERYRLEGCCAQAALFPKRANVNSVARKAQTRADSSLRHLPRPAQRKSTQSVRQIVEAEQKRRVNDSLLRGARQERAPHLCEAFPSIPSNRCRAHSGDPSERHTGAGAVHSHGMATILSETLSDGMESILQFIDEGTKAAAFEHNWMKLERAETSHVDLDALKICVRLLPPFSSDESVSTGQHRIV